MNLIWRKGPSTVREVRDRLSETEKRAVTTIATFLNILVSKKFLDTEREGRSLVFSAKVTKSQYQCKALSYIKQTLFDGSARKMIESVILSERTTFSELSKIADFLDSRLR